MCGIFGAVGNMANRREGMILGLAALGRRGPDGSAFSAYDGLFLGHSRLAINDLSDKGEQPFVEKNRSISVCVNGEIYNFKSLRSELCKKYSFKGSSDSEVALWGYIEWGISGLLERMRGMYALVVSTPQEVILATDRYGKKPIFYLRAGNSVLFSSEVKAFWEVPGLEPKFSRRGVFNWINYRGSDPESTIYHGVGKLPPATFIRIDRESLSISKEKYFDNSETFMVKKSYDAEKFLELFLGAVERRLISDVPVGLQLSGGLDSSMVAWALSELGCSIRSYSIGFSEPEYQRFSEEKFATRVASQFSLEHTQINLQLSELEDYLPAAVEAFDGMLDYPNAIPLMKLAEVAKRNCTVMLTGDGSDEICGGYLKYTNLLRLQTTPALPFLNCEHVLAIFPKLVQKRLRNLYLSAASRSDESFLLRRLNSFIPPSFIHHFGEMDAADIERADFNSLAYEDQVLLEDQRTYLRTMFERQDRTCAYYGVEGRSPFTDEDLIGYVNSLPPREKFSLSGQKIFLKRAAEDIFGSEFVYRRKMGFPMPLEKILNESPLLAGAWIRITSGESVINHIFPKEALRGYLAGKRFRYGLVNYGDDYQVYVRWYLCILDIAAQKFNVRGVAA